MSEAREPEIIVPPGLEGGVFANVVLVFSDIEHVTIDFARLDPHDFSFAFLVARVSAPTSCILDMKQKLEHIT